MFTEWFRKLFGDKGTSQIGRGQQVVTGSTAGSTSPVVTAGRDVSFSMSIPPALEEDKSTFSDLEEMMPEFLEQLRVDLAEYPLCRDIVVLDKSTYVYNYQKGHLMFAE